MSASQDIKDEVGMLRSAPESQFIRGGRPINPPADSPDARLAALEDDVQALLRALLIAGEHIDDLRKELDGR